MCRDVLAVVPKSLEGYWLLVSLSEGFIAMLWIAPLQLLSGAPLPALPGRNCLMGHVSLLRLSVIGYQLLVIGYWLLVFSLWSSVLLFLACLLVNGYWSSVLLPFIVGLSICSWILATY